MFSKIGAAILGLLLLPGIVLADPWKDESGKRGKGHEKHDHGETPGWARGRGYWDGHFKHDRRGDWRGWYRGYGDFGYGRYPGWYGYSPYGGPGWDRGWSYRPYYDRPEGIYSPWGFYQEYPHAPHDDYYRHPHGYGRIGPFRFEVWH